MPATKPILKLEHKKKLNIMELGSDVNSYIFSFFTRSEVLKTKDICKFFRERSINIMHNNPLLYNNYKNLYDGKSHSEIIQLRHDKVNESICSWAVLKNGDIVSGTYANHINVSQLCVWNISHGKEAIKIADHICNRNIDNILALSNGLVVTTACNTIYFWNFKNAINEQLITRIPLILTEDYCSVLAVCELDAKHLLISMYHNQKYVLKLITFDEAWQADSYKQPDIRIETIIVQSSQDSYISNIVKLNDNKIITSDNDLQNKIKIWDINTLLNSDAQGKLKPERAITAATYGMQIVKLDVNLFVTLSFSGDLLQLWDISRPQQQECTHTIKLEEADNGIFQSRHLLTKLKSNKIAVIRSRMGMFKDTQLLVFDYSATNLNEIYKKNISLSIDRYQLVHGGQYLIGTRGYRIICFPYLQFFLNDQKDKSIESSPGLSNTMKNNF